METEKKLIESLNKKPKTLLFWKGYLLDWVIDIAIAGLIVYIITTFAFQNMYVVGSSMSPTLTNGETVLINKITYRLKTPKQNEIVSFRHVDSSGKEMNIVKRIIGTPGDKIEIKDDILYLNDQVQEELPSRGNMTYPITVPEGSYFVLGDNKANSMDSRYQEIGMIAEEELTGKIVVRIWPFWKIKRL